MHWARGLRLGSIRGIDIIADPSLAIIFVLILFSLAAGVFPAWHPQWSAGLCWMTAAAAALLFFGSVLVHELSHALVGRPQGVQFKRITLFMFGGVAQMETEPPSWRAELSMAAAGPVTSLALGFAFLALAALASGPLHIEPNEPRAALAALGPLATLLFWLGPVNIVLGLFNLVPGFPLDGGRVLRAVMWALSGDLHRATYRASLAGRAFAWLLVAAGILMILGIEVPLLGGGLINGLWLAFIGWDLNNAALLSYRELLLRESLEHVPASKLMLTRFVRITPHMRIDTLIDGYLMTSGQRAFPVEVNGRLVGMVSLRDLQKYERVQWHDVTVGDAMTPITGLATIAPDTSALEALEIIARRDLAQLPVVQGESLLGLLRREDILKWLSLHTAIKDMATIAGPDSR
ncbi:MAG: site-2 protease family protein [Gammaproteobacteria bacterium]|nr:site-2 protease family protein [Gammaproteobacteria bacterium]